MAPLPVRGLVFHGPQQPPAIEDLWLDPPGPGEVRVRMVAAGVCHSDLHVVDGDWQRPPGVVLGHEGAGVVVELGPGVTERPASAAIEDGGLRVGDLVALTWTAPCEGCHACRRGEGWLCATPRGSGHRLDHAAIRLHRADGSGLGAYSGIGTFCTGQVVAAEAAIAIDPQTPRGIAAMIGCAATTGIGAVRSTADVRAGQSAIVIGLGGVGLAAVLGAVERGAHPIIASDIEPAKLALAMSLGVHEAVEPEALPALAASLPSSGADHVLECIGLRETVELAVRVARPGGQVTLVGMTAMGVHAGIDVYRLVEEGKRIAGSNYGSSIPARDFPRIAADVVAGRLPLERLVTEEIGLDDVVVALEAMRRREGVRRIVVFGA